LPALTPEIASYSIAIAIGGTSVRVNTSNPSFLRILEERYAGFLSESESAAFDFDVELIDPAANDVASGDARAELCVSLDSGQWKIERGDFLAEWTLASRRGRIRQSANPYSIDAVLRILHSLVAVKQGGFLLHSASAIRNGKAFLFAGVSGAGKTTISRLAPADVTLLTDEISYVRKQGESYAAYGTPFTGELAKIGENTSAPLGALYLLQQGPENRIDAIDSADAARELLANMLFFADDREMVYCAFKAACDFVDRVPVSRLTFLPDARVWEMIGACR
jgi:hypothetical protein